MNDRPVDGRSQGWLAGAGKFSQKHTVAIVLAELVNAVWMTWLLVVGWRTRAAGSASRHRVLR